VLIGKFSVSENRTESGEVILDISGKTVNNGTSGIVDKIILVEKDFNLRLAKVRVRKIKNPEIGDKFAARSGQKGTIGMVIPAEDMPFTQDGIVPDIIMNPHAIPSRMTINQLLECILGKAACHYGNIGNCTAFEHSDVSNISDVLEKTGYEKYGNEILYNGITGEQINTQIFFGPTYYQRLKLMVADKVQSRATGPRDYITRQAAAGRSNKGGLRIGEMERDAILSHGASLFLKETTMKRSDDYSTYFNNRNGMIVNDNIYESSNDNINRVDIPYSMKLFIQELQSMSISAKCVLETRENDTQLLQDIIPKIKNNGNMSYDPESGDGEEEGAEVEADE
jgi:DNA-directed RNA polymerase II subunit RPB2